MAYLNSSIIQSDTMSATSNIRDNIVSEKLNEDGVALLNPIISSNKINGAKTSENKEFLPDQKEKDNQRAYMNDVIIMKSKPTNDNSKKSLNNSRNRRNSTVNKIIQNPAFLLILPGLPATSHISEDNIKD